jgi:hypothetical protein
MCGKIVKMSAKMGPKYKKVDASKIKALASISCTQEEIAAVLDVSVDTIQRRFLPIIEIGKQKCRASLRRKMYETAMSDRHGAVTAQIWLSKQYLGFRDQVETHSDAKVVVYPAEYIEAVNRALGFTGEFKPIGSGEVIEGHQAEIGDVLPE